MHYKLALARVVACHKTNWGSFTELFPDMEEEDLQKKIEALKVCGKEMFRIIDAGEVGLGEASRFIQEMETVLLLLIICIWGTSEDDVPLTEDDMMQVMAAMNSLCAAGVEEDGYLVRDVAKKLIEEGVKTKALPSSVALLYPEYFPPYKGLE
jgi:hypothetical protein